MIAIARIHLPGVGTRVGAVLDGALYDVTTQFPSVSAFLAGSQGRVTAAIDDLRAAAQGAQRYDLAHFDHAPSPDYPHWLPPCDQQEVWASGVTYERSREARQEEAVDGGDIYARVYRAERPELFFKALGPRVIGHLGEVGIRQDATWNVPEPELTILANPAMEAVGFTVGNDMSSRDIEGENPLYLPQAKVYNASCALGPWAVLLPASEWPSATISVAIVRGGQTLFSGETHTARLKRRIGELLGYLGRSNSFPNGVFLLTGTGVVPPGEFTLQAGDRVTITIEGIGTLSNTVKVV
ncbi:MAG: fumarylacetoacetate hydrolase family protein [Anaerolineae bacterium]|nr:fumarylacetoacetate hydrolase family protein [Anaerolineae bacterium]